VQEQLEYDAMVRDITVAVNAFSLGNILYTLFLESRHSAGCWVANQRHDTLQEREAQAKSEGGIVTYKAQLSVGLHVIVMMGTFFAAGYTGLSYLSADRVHVRTPPIFRLSKATI
jgi:hypothetical protein